LTNYPYSAFEPKPPPTSHLTSTLPMTTLTPPTTNAIAPLALPSRLWVTNCTPSYTVPTHPPSLTLPSLALPALLVDMTSAPGPRTPRSNKLLFCLGPAPRNSSANTTKHGPTPLPTHAHNSSTHSNLTFSNTNPQPLPGPHTLSPPPLPVPSLMIHSVRSVTAPLTREKCFSVTFVTPIGIWTAWSPPLLPSLLGYENVPCVPLLPPYPAVHCDTSASPLPSLTLTLTKHHIGKKTPILCQHNILLSTPQLLRRSRYFSRKERSCLTTYGVDPNINQFLSRERILTPHPHTRL